MDLLPTDFSQLFGVFVVLGLAGNPHCSKCTKFIEPTLKSIISILLDNETSDSPDLSSQAVP